MSLGMPRTATTPDIGLTMTLRLASVPTIATSVVRSSLQKSMSLSVAIWLLGGPELVVGGVVVPGRPATLLVLLPALLEVIEPEVTRMSVEPRRLPAR